MNTRNPLTGILTPKVRRYLYAAFFVAGVALGALKLADVDTGATAQILAYIGAALGLTAASNTPSPETTNEVTD